MNTGQIYHLISIICYILSALAFAFTVYLFFRYKVLNIFNILSGRKLKQDMDRLSHLSGAASEDSEGGASTGPSHERGNGRGKNKKPVKTEKLYGISQSGKPGKNDTEELEENGSASDTEELYNTEVTEVLYKTEVTEELYQTEETEELPGASDTDELNVVVTGASDTELL